MSVRTLPSTDGCSGHLHAGYECKACAACTVDWSLGRCTVCRGWLSLCGSRYREGVVFRTTPNVIPGFLPDLQADAIAAEDMNDS